jgi:hypothetical protein
MLCPTCKNSLKRSTTLITGSIVLWCTHCQAVTVEGSGTWLPRGAGALDALRILAGKVEEARNIDHEAMYSDISDPRWTQIG